MHELQVLVRRQLSAAWRHRWWAVLFTWLICAVGWTMTFAIPNQYETSARLYVDTDAVLTPLLRGLAADNGQAGQIDTLQRTLLSRPNLEKLVSSTDLALSVTGPSDLEQMVDRLTTAIRLVPQTRNLFTITYRDQSPKLAYDVVQTILTTFVENKTGNNRAEIANAQTFVQQQINAYERQLREAERKRAEFRAKYVDLLPAGESGATRLGTAQAAVRQLQGQLTDAVARRDLLVRELSSTSPLIVTETDPGGSGGGGGGSRLREAEHQLQEMRLRYTDQHPDVIALRNLIGAMRSGAVGSSDPGQGATRATPARNRSVPNPVYEQLKVRLVENDTVVSSLQRQVADEVKERDRLEEIARSAPGLQAEFTNLNRDYDVLRKNFEELLARRESMRIAAAADSEGDKLKLQIVDPPQVPQNPVAPKRMLLLSGVLFAALAGGAALALLLVQFDQSFHSIDDARDLGFTVVGGVSLLGGSMPLGRRLASIGAFALAVLLPVLVYGGLAARLMGIKLLA